VSAPLTLDRLATVRDDPDLCQQLRRAMRETYYAALPAHLLQDDEGGKRLDYEAIDRLANAARWVVPWVQARIDLSRLTVVDFGCGTGSSAAAFALVARDVIGYDIDASSIAGAHARFAILGLQNASAHLIDPDFVTRSRADGGASFAAAHPDGCDVILLFAVAEHLLQRERIAYLRAFWRALRPGGFLIVVDTPNRLCLWDYHTSFLPFFHLLPEEIAIQYANRSSRAEFASALASLTAAPFNAQSDALHRWGTALSFHDFEIAFERDLRGLILCNGYEYQMVNWFPPNAEEQLMVGYFFDKGIPHDIGFARTVLNLVFRKPGSDGSELPPVALSRDWCETFIPWHGLDERLHPTLCPR
jgi:SAM-dependent methyltransferase